jgi:hypothetical protein
VQSQLFEDDFKSYQYETGVYCERNFTTQLLDNTYYLKQEITGTYRSNITEFHLILHGFQSVENIKTDIGAVEFMKENKNYICTVPASTNAIMIQL